MSPRILAPGALLLAVGLMACEDRSDRAGQQIGARDGERGSAGYADSRTGDRDRMDNQRLGQAGSTGSSTGSGGWTGSAGSNSGSTGVAPGSTGSMGTGSTGTGSMGSTGSTGTVTGSNGGSLSAGAGQQVTPTSQGNNAADLETTRMIRRALLDNKQLSVAAKNLTVVTSNQVVTLRGSVQSKDEHMAAMAAARAAAGTNRVDDQIVVDEMTAATR